MILSHARLPIPPLRHEFKEGKTYLFLIFYYISRESQILGVVLKTSWRKLMKDEYYRDYLDIVRSFRQYLEERKEKGVKAVSSENEDSQELLEKLFYSIQRCRKCPLYKFRTNPVLGRGNPKARIMLIGEAPGREEDLQGKPFVGAAGRLLGEDLRKAEIPEEDIYIANVLKCRPPRNRDPSPEEIKACFPFLLEQIRIVNPKVICTLGKFATQTLLNTKQSILRLRGKVLSYQGKILLIPTFHPAACIYRPDWRKFFLQDLCLVREQLSRRKGT